MATSRIDILLNLRDEASKKVKEFKRNLGDLDGTVSALSGGLGGILGAAGVGAAAVAIGQITSAINDSVMAADRFSKVDSSFQQLTQSAGQSSSAILQALRSSSSGMINDTDLMLAANKAMMLGVADSAEEMTALLNIARARGQAMGIDVGQAFDNIVTGLGRESALILDNLGITIDTTAAMQAYAAQLGTTADKLDGAQRKQALLNEVMKQSANITADMPTGAGAAAAQAKAAQENAQVAVGKFFAPVSREWADAQTDIINQLMGSFDAYTAKVRDVSQIAVDITNDRRSDGAQKNRWQTLAEGMQLVLQAQQRGVPTANYYANAMTNIANQAELSRNITADQAQVVNQLTTAIKAETAAFDASLAALNALDPKLDQIRGKEQALTLAANQAAAAHRAMSAAFAMGVPSASLQSGGRGLDYFQQRAAILDPLQAQIDSQASQLVGTMGQQQALDWAHEQKLLLRDQADTLYEQGYQWSEIGNVLMPSIVAQTGKWVSDTNKISSGVGQVNDKYNDLLGTVQSILSEAQSDTGGADPSTILPREDAVAENARRLGAIMNEGLNNQSWLEDFKNTAPGAYADLMLKIAEGADAKTAAAQILQDFQDGLRTDLINKDAVKERVKKMILGEQNMSALAQEIASELAQEMNIPLSQAMQAASSVLNPGGATKTDTAAGLADGLASATNGKALVEQIATQMDAASERMKTAGQNAGTVWGVGFMATVETSVSTPLINLLVALVTPGIMAQFALTGTLTTPTDQTP